MGSSVGYPVLGSGPLYPHVPSSTVWPKTQADIPFLCRGCAEALAPCSDARAHASNTGYDLRRPQPYGRRDVEEMETTSMSSMCRLVSNHVSVI